MLEFYPFKSTNAYKLKAEHIVMINSIFDLCRVCSRSNWLFI